MVDTTFFLLQLIGILVLAFWAATHDGDDQAAEGVLAMTDPPKDDAAALQTPRRRERSALRRSAKPAARSSASRHDRRR